MLPGDEIVISTCALIQEQHYTIAQHQLSLNLESSRDGCQSTTTRTKSVPRFLTKSYGYRNGFSVAIGIKILRFIIILRFYNPALYRKVIDWGYKLRHDFMSRNTRTIRCAFLQKYCSFNNFQNSDADLKGFWLATQHNIKHKQNEMQRTHLVYNQCNDLRSSSPSSNSAVFHAVQ